MHIDCIDFSLVLINHKLQRLPRLCELYKMDKLGKSVVPPSDLHLIPNTKKALAGTRPCRNVSSWNVTMLKK